MITGSCLCGAVRLGPGGALGTDAPCRCEDVLKGWTDSRVPCLRLRRELPGSPAACALIAALDEDLARVYPPAVIFGLHDDDHLEDRMVFLVARIAERPVACAALRSLEPAMGEVKRMYVAPEVRGQGVARRLLGHVEAVAVARGHEVLRLETGNRSPAALALYRSGGYRGIEPYGEYVGNAYSVCFEKILKEPGARTCAPGGAAGHRLPPPRR